jgi:hypothetical protein
VSEAIGQQYRHRYYHAKHCTFQQLFSAFTKIASITVSQRISLICTVYCHIPFLIKPTCEYQNSASNLNFSKIYFTEHYLQAKLLITEYIFNLNQLTLMHAGSLEYVPVVRTSTAAGM